MTVDRSAPARLNGPREADRDLELVQRVTAPLRLTFAAGRAWAGGKSTIIACGPSTSRF